MARDASGYDNAPRQVVSLQNERVKAIRALSMRKHRRESGHFLAEGVSVLVSAREAGFVPVSLVYSVERATSDVCRSLVDWAVEAGSEVLEVTDAILAKLSTKDNPQVMLGVFSQRYSHAPDTTKLNDDTVWIALEEVRDPGNLGTIIRTADAVGAAGVVLVGTCCDPYSREAVRASMGSVFHVLVASVEDHAAFDTVLKSWPGDIVGLHLDGHEDFRSARYRLPAMIVMGSEGPGLSQRLSTRCSKLVKIPMSGTLDSLNLSVATALMAYQIRGQFLSL